MKKRKSPILVVIDPGHGGFDWGLNTKKEGKRIPHKGYNGISEEDINLEIANKVAWLCSRHNLGYLMTRWGDRATSLSDRIKAANSAPAVLYLSIHCNYALKSAYRGVETWYCEGSLLGLRIAQKMQRSLVDLGYTKNRGIKSGKFYVLRKTKMPAVLIELGFLSNREDALYLNNPSNQDLIAVKIWRTIKEICL